MSQSILEQFYLSSRRVTANGSLPFVERESGGGCSSNTPPATPNGEQSDIGGTDTLEVSCYCKWKESHLSEVMEELKSSQEYAREKSKWVSAVIGGFVVQVSSAGAKADNGTFWPFVFRRDGAVYIMNTKSEPSGTMPNVKVSIGSKLLLKHGGSAFDAFTDCKQFLKGLGCEVYDTAVSRWDSFVDLVDCPVSDFVGLWHNSAFVTRARWNRDFHAHTEDSIRESLAEYERFLRGEASEYSFFGSGHKPTGLVIGKRIMVRIYDKTREVKRDPDKQALLRSLWGNETEEVTRVEFQMRSDALRDRGIRTVSDLHRLQHSVTHYLTHKWLVVRQPGLDRKHTTRSPVNELWNRVQHAFLKVFTGQPEELKPIRKPQLAHLRAQTKGLLLTLYSCEIGKNIHPDKFEPYVTRLTGELQRAIFSSDTPQRDLQKRVSTGLGEMLSRLIPAESLTPESISKNLQSLASMAVGNLSESELGNELNDRLDKFETRTPASLFEFDHV